MNKKKLICFASLFCLALTSCADTSELYEGNAYDTGDFSSNYYDVYEDDFTNASKINKEYSVTGTKLRERTADFSGGNDTFNVEDMTNDEGVILSYPGYTDSKTAGNNIDYGFTKNLSSINSSFARGYVSKLFDGRVQCFGHYAKSRVQINEKGFGFKFDNELTSYKYLAVSLRGASGYEISVPRTSTVNLNITFYVYNHDTNIYEGYKFAMNNLSIPTDAGGANVVLYGFYFNEVLDNYSILKRASAMSIDYKLVYDPVVSEDPSIDYALMLYEILLPNSSWN